MTRATESEENVAVIGDGAMGTLCAVLLAENGCSVRLWSAFADQARQLAHARENRRFLPGVALPAGIEVGADEAWALSQSAWAVSAVPTQFMRGVWRRLARVCPAGLAICSVAKGIENQTLLRPTQVLRDVLDHATDSPRGVAVLSGPSIAPEVAQRKPASVTVAATETDFAVRIQRRISRPYFRVYTNADVIGVEIAGATKNVIAIAAGILDGLSAGDNAKAALVTRGLAEIARLAEAMGGRSETFAGLAGVGDLVTTCISPVGRNRSFGQAVGEGKTVAQAAASLEGVVEGVATTQSVLQLSERMGVDMPITRAVHSVLFDGVAAPEAIASLMSRPLKAES